MSEQTNPLHDDQRAPDIVAIGGGWYRNRSQGKETIYANASTHETSSRWPNSVKRPPGKEWESSDDGESDDSDDNQSYEIGPNEGDEDRNGDDDEDDEEDLDASARDGDGKWARERFVEAAGHETGTLNVQQFKSLCKQIFSQEEIPSEGDLVRAFTITDEDMSGDIDQEEFLHLFAMVREGKLHGFSMKWHFSPEQFAGGGAHMSRSALALKRRMKARPRDKGEAGAEIYKGLTFKPLTNIDYAMGRSLKQGRKLPNISMDEGSSLSFLKNTFKYTGTILENMRGQIFLTLFMVMLANVVRSNAPYMLPSELLSMHAFFGKLLAFFLAFRLNESVAAYQSGRQNIEDTLNALREMVTHLYCQGISQDAKSDPYHEYLRRELVRYVNLQFSLMRQALREANEGFTPGCGIVGKEFKDYWQLDPVEPRIANLVTKEEYLALKYIPPLARPTFIQTKINLLANKLSGYKELPGIFLLNFVRKHMKAMDAFESSIRIMETPVPMPYRHLILLFSFTYVYTYPWFAVTIKDAGGNSRIGHTDDADGLIGWVEAIVVRRFFLFRRVLLVSVAHHTFFHPTRHT
jgi:predicted membrane chloride channel (bestrophin family)